MVKDCVPDLSMDNAIVDGKKDVTIDPAGQGSRNNKKENGYSSKFIRKKWKITHRFFPWFSFIFVSTVLMIQKQGNKPCNAIIINNGKLKWMRNINLWLIMVRGSLVMNYGLVDKTFNNKWVSHTNILLTTSPIN